MNSRKTAQRGIRDRLTSTRFVPHQDVACRVLGFASAGRILRCLLALALLATFNSAQNLHTNALNGPSSGANRPAQDRVVSQTNLFTGSFQTSIPIELPPGRNNSTPTVALTYDSRNGNGWCGIGWSLDLGHIERNTERGVPATWVGVSPGNQYDDSKGFRFILNGVGTELVQVSSSPVEVWRPKIDQSYVRFERVGQQWVAIAADGTRYDFGSDDASRMMHPTWYPLVGTNKWACTFRWALDKVTDTSGNQSVITYTKDQDQLYPAQVAWNGNPGQGQAPTHTLTFGWETRPDQLLSFRSGFRVGTFKRLLTLIAAIGAAPARKYVISWEESPSTRRSRIHAVQLLGDDLQTALPPWTFTYNDRTLEFENPISWPNLDSQGQTIPGWSSTRSVNSDFNTNTALIDMDGDALPDRVMRQVLQPPQTTYTAFPALRGRPNSFASGGVVHNWTNLQSQGHESSQAMNSVNTSSSSTTSSLILDMDGNGYPDRVHSEFSQIPGGEFFVVQLNNGLTFENETPWGPLDPGSYGSTNPSPPWSSLVGRQLVNNGGTLNTVTTVALVDINGDTLPDRVVRKPQSPYSWWNVQLNNGSGFDPAFIRWSPLQYNSAMGPYIVDSTDICGTREEATLEDMNGDGLLDRVMQKGSSPYNYFAVQFNNGYGFEQWVEWGPLLHDSGYTGPCKNTPTLLWGFGGVSVDLLDVTGDGLPDRVLMPNGAPFDHWRVQVNLGSGFRSALDTISNVHCETGDCEPLFAAFPGVNSDLDSVADVMDMDGDGLLDRVMRKAVEPYDSNLIVQLAAGPFPDLLRHYDNGTGGTVDISYVPSAWYDNRDILGTADPWVAGARSTLPFSVPTVASVTRNDGITGLQTTTYSYAGGSWNSAQREFRGFFRVTEVSPKGTNAITYFHQGGGVDGTSLGEFEDAGKDAKAGLPFRTELWELVGQSLVLRQVTVHKIECLALNPVGWNWPYEGQAVRQDFAPNGQYRSIGSRTWLDPVTARTMRTAEYGEVSLTGDPSAHAFTDLQVNDSVFTQITYASLSNPDIVSRRDAERVTADELGVGPSLRETRYEWFGATGQPKKTRKWLDLPSPKWIEGQSTYDGWGNLETTTDPRGTTVVLTYDLASHTFPEMRQTTAVTQAGPTTFVTHATYKPLSGMPWTQTDETGLLTQFTYDHLNRLVLREVQAPGTSTLVPLESRSYLLGGVTGGISSNAVVTYIKDNVDAAGIETRSYLDGFGRTIQVRSEAEGTNAYRVSGTVFDGEGNASRAIAPFLSSGPAFELWPMGALQHATVTEHDALQRAVRVDPPSTEVGAETGPTVVSYGINGDPWCVTTTDAEASVKSTYLDAFGRLARVVEAIGPATGTSYSYNRFGDLRFVTDVANHVVENTYDSFGRRLARTHPDSGLTTWEYDDMGAVVNTIDAVGRRVHTQYDGLGRPTQQDAFEAGSGMPASTFTWEFDQAVTAGLSVGPLQLARVVDDEGSNLFGYDARGRTTETRRVLSKSGQTYRTRMTYDDMDRQLTIKYPSPTGVIAPVVAYAYDRAGHIIEARATAGLGPSQANLVLYSAIGFTADDQVGSFSYGNGVRTDVDWYDHYKLPQRLHSYEGAVSLQDLAFEYDAVANVKKLFDTLETGLASSTLLLINYDPAHRLTFVQRLADAYDFNYDDTGNTTLNEEAGPGGFTYFPGQQPHAARSANGVAYSYDACGNMIARGGQTLVWDARQHLDHIVSASGTVEFGYAYDGDRLWREDQTLNVWIGATYELKGSQRLCHVNVGGRRVATFQPADTQIGGGGAGQSSFGIQDQPIWYYHADHLGGTNLITDLSGAIVQQVEYNTYGTTRYETSGSQFSTDNLFTGEVLDRTTGLYYLGARYLDPALSRFTQCDPVEGVLDDPQTLNPYTYALNNPLRYVDPTGAYADEPILFGPDRFGNYEGGSDRFGGMNDLLRNPAFIAVTWTSDTIEAEVYPFAKKVLDYRNPAFGSLAAETALAVTTVASLPTLGSLVTTGLKQGVKAAAKAAVKKGSQSLVDDGIRAVSSTAERQAIRAAELGRAGEAAVREAYDIGEKTAIEVAGRVRIPDGLTSSVLSEVKNVASLSYTQQLRDYTAYALERGMRFDLYVRPGNLTKLSSTLTEEVLRGNINLKYIPFKP